MANVLDYVLVQRPKNPATQWIKNQTLKEKKEKLLHLVVNT